MNKKVLVIGLGVLALGAGAYFILKDRKEKKELEGNLQSELEKNSSPDTLVSKFRQDKIKELTRSEVGERTSKAAPPARSSSSSSSKCPSGMVTYGDGSACKSNKNADSKCALWGNVGLQRCACPKGTKSIGDGSACETTIMGEKVRCAKWGNSGMSRCPKNAG